MTNEADTPKVRGFFKRLRAKLNQGPAWLTADLGELLPGRKIDAEILDDLETRLITADVGAEATSRIQDDLRKRVARKELTDVDALLKALHDAMLDILKPVETPLTIDPAIKPYVILVVGINGAGKTTTIGKLARRLLAEGHSVMLAAGDTFRAAAREQLEVWAERNQVPIIAQQGGAEPAAVIYDGLQAARARRIDVLIADTAGRLHTQTHLMDELKKVKRVLQRLDAGAPHEVLLVLDGTIGQNAVAQAEEFHKGLGVTGLVVTKLDGTAKGGVVLAIAQNLKIPIRFVGVGEDTEDFGVFNASDFVSALLKSDPGELAFLTGHSGAGKSSILKLIALIERPTRGQVFINNQNTASVKARGIPQFRRSVGVVFQDHKLLHDRPVADNVALPLIIAGVPKREIAKRVRAALDQVGLLGT